MHTGEHKKKKIHAWQAGLLTSRGSSCPFKYRRRIQWHLTLHSPAGASASNWPPVCVTHYGCCENVATLSSLPAVSTISPWQVSVNCLCRKMNKLFWLSKQQKADLAPPASDPERCLLSEEMTQKTGTSIQSHPTVTSTPNSWLPIEISSLFEWRTRLEDVDY